MIYYRLIQLCASTQLPQRLFITKEMESLPNLLQKCDCISSTRIIAVSHTPLPVVFLNCSHLLPNSTNGTLIHVIRNLQKTNLIWSINIKNPFFGKYGILADYVNDIEPNLVQQASCGGLNRQRQWIAGPTRNRPQKTDRVSGGLVVLMATEWK